MPNTVSAASIRVARNLWAKALFSHTNSDYVRQLGDLGVLRGVIHGFSEEARTRGFPSPSLGGFGFVVSCCRSLIHLAAGENLIVDISGLVQPTV